MSELKTKLIDPWQERELHCKWYGHSLTHVLRREPIRLPMSPNRGQPDDKPQGVPHVEIRQCGCCLREFRNPILPEQGK